MSARLVVTQRHSRNPHGDWVDSLENSYHHYFASFDAVLLPISNACRDPDRFVEVCRPDGIILSGGGDISPERSGLPGGEETSTERDRCETVLLETAVRSGIPVLGICRGLQFIQVYFGGTISDLQHLGGEGAHPPAGDHRVSARGWMAGDTPWRDGVRVNSFHRRGVTRGDLGPNLETFAVSEDLELVEGLRHRDLPIAAVQWHPERDGAPQELDAFLVRAFLSRSLFWEVRR